MYLATPSRLPSEKKQIKQKIEKKRSKTDQYAPHCALFFTFPRRRPFELLDQSSHERDLFYGRLIVSCVLSLHFLMMKTTQVYFTSLSGSLKNRAVEGMKAELAQCITTVSRGRRKVVWGSLNHNIVTLCIVSISSLPSRVSVRKSFSLSIASI